MWPLELRTNTAFVRKGNAFNTVNDQPVIEIEGDFDDLKSLVVNSATAPLQAQVQDIIILAYQYLIAKYDIDGLRIDSLLYVDRGFAQTFANAIREYSLTIGKKNFFTYGEVTSDERTIANFVGRVATDPTDFYGTDAALDFPLKDTLGAAVKILNGKAPSDVAQVFADRHAAEEGTISSHGEASSFFVTFLDNHDGSARFGYLGEDAGDPWRDQVKLGLTALLTLQGIPCIYYGTEQSLQGHAPPNTGDSEYVREALWGKPGQPFDLTSPMAQLLTSLTGIRASEPALRYGRQYFRQTADAGSTSFSVSTAPGGPMAYSRILAATEILVVCNTNNETAWTGDVIIDTTLNPDGSRPVAWSSTKGPFSFAAAVSTKPQGSISIDGNVTGGGVRTINVSLQPMEAQIIRPTPDPGQTAV